MRRDRKKKVIVIGGGAAGMMAAIFAARSGASAEIIERNEKLGKKLFITGKGRCNFTNACAPEELSAHVVTGERFLRSAFAGFDNRETAAFFESLGLQTKVERGGRVFPASDKSSDVIRALEHELGRLGVAVRLNSRVASLIIEGPPAGGVSEPRERRVRGVRLADGEEIAADAVILAAGGCSYPSTGSDGIGYSLAEEAGHSVCPARPALVPLLCAESFLPRLQGLSLRNVELRVSCGKKKEHRGFGELLFTDRGITGPLALTASSYIGGALAAGSLPAHIDLKPALSAEKLDARLLREICAAPRKDLRNLAASLYPASLRPVIIDLSGIPADRKAAELTRGERARIVELTKRFPLTVTGTAGFREAVVTQGGVLTKEIDPRTMGSKKCAGLYFAGEIMDLDAVTGGFNLQIAWSTARAAGTAAAEEGGRQMSYQIAIDGPSGAGKSTIAKELARRLGFIYVDTGAMYRAMGLHLTAAGVDTDDEAACSEAASGAEIGWKLVGGAQHIYLNGRDVSVEIRTEEAGMTASKTSAYGGIRRILVRMQQEIAASQDVVMDGRDIGTVVLPDADLKIFLTASVEVRAMRRYKELLGKGQQADLSKVEEDIRQRDWQDTHREVSPLAQAPDAILVDTSDMSIEEVTEHILGLVGE